MPGRAARECSYPGCHTLVRDGSGRCAVHPAPVWQHFTPTDRVTGRRLQKKRLALFKRQPLCVRCEREGRVALATIRDHVVALAEGGLDVESNVQALCQACHNLKTAEESRRGKRRV